MKKIIIFGVFALILVVSYYLIFSKEDWEEEIGFPIRVSDEQKYAEKLTENDIEKFVFYSLPDKAMEAQFGGKVFCSSKIFGSEKNFDKNIMEIFAFSYCEEYYLTENVVTLGSGIATPIKIIFTINKDELIFQSVIFPKNGSEYEKSLGEMFPEPVLSQVKMPLEKETLIPLPKTQAENYYKGKLEVYF